MNSVITSSNKQFVTSEKIEKGNFSFYERMKQYLSNVILLVLAFSLYTGNKYYIKYLNPWTVLLVSVYILSYIILGFVFYTFFLKEVKNNTKGYIVLNMLKRWANEALIYLKNFPYNLSVSSPKITEDEKNALLFVILKLFFIPVMLNFSVGNFMLLYKSYIHIKSAGLHEIFSLNGFNQYIYSVLFGILIFTDTIIFSFGYMFEAGFLRNKVRSVEPSMFGWIAALICYPPFNTFLGMFIKSYSNDFPLVDNIYYTFALRIIVLSFYGIYLWATLAFGTKASNLTYRGLVSKGPYAIVRHPAYISKNVAWWISTIPIMNLSTIINMIIISFIYFLRAITEEKHLLKYEEYREYCKKVKYRFIPFVY